MRPFTVTNTAEFTIRPGGIHTTATWSLTGRNNFMFKAVDLIALGIMVWVGLYLREIRLKGLIPLRTL